MIKNGEDLLLLTTHPLTHFTISSPPQKTLVTEAWKKLRFSSKLYVSPDPSSMKQIDANFNLNSKPVLMSVKDNGQEKYVFPGLVSATTTAADIIEWAQLHKTPLVRQLDADNSDEILSTDRLVVMAVSDPANAQVHDRTVSVLKQSARIMMNREDAAGRAIFVWLDGVKWGDYVRRVYGNEIADKKPSIVIADPGQELYYDVDADGQRFEAKEENILTAIKQITQNKLKVSRRSSSRSFDAISTNSMPLFF
jgi:hypothetical protein